MSFYIREINISNFLSFFGNHKAELKPFTGIICNFDQGKDDFFKALQFVFGADLKDINVEKTKDLINANIRKHGGETSENNCYVEVVLRLAKKDRDEVKMKRAVTNQRIEYCIGKKIVSVLRYRENLDALGLNVKNKNLIFYKKYFNDVIDGTSEDLEKVITKCLRAPYLAEKLKKAQHDVRHLQEVEQDLDKRKYSICKTDHKTVSEFVDKYEGVQLQCESLKQKLLNSIQKDCEENSQEISDSQENTPILTTGSEELDRLEVERERKMNRILALETEKENILENYDELKSEKSELLSKLYYCEIKLAKESETPNLVTDRIKLLKGLLRKEENKLPTLFRKIKENEVELQVIAENLQKDFELIVEIRRRKELKVPLSVYGRLADHISPSGNLNLLRNILGDDLFFANLVDTKKEAMDCIGRLATEEYDEYQETFICFEDNKKLKEVILMSEENGVDVCDLEKLQIFLFKLQSCELISKVPILIKRNFSYEVPEEIENDIIFTTDGMKLSSGGSITRLEEYTEVNFENEEEILNRINDLIINQEMKFHEIDDLYFQRWESKAKMTSLEDDISFLKRNLRKIKDKEQKKIFYGSAFIPGILDVYDNYEDVFIIHQLQNEADQQEAEEFMGLVPATPEEAFDLDNLQSYRDEILENIRTLESDLEEKEKVIFLIEKEIRELSASFLCLKQIPTMCHRKPTNLKSHPIFFYNELMSRLKELMKVEDIYEFKSTREWRIETLKSLEKDFKDLKKELAESKNTLHDISNTRKNKLKLLTDHCSRYFCQTLEYMLHTAIRFLELVFNDSSDELQIVTSLKEDRVNLLDFEVLNKFLKFGCALCLFLQISLFEKIPIMFLDDVSNFFPKDDDSVTQVLPEDLVNQILPESENLSHDLIMRIGQYLEYFTRMHTTRPPIRMGPQQINGPAQLLIFTDLDLTLAPQHQVLITQKIVPEEYIRRKSSYFSAINTTYF